MITDAVLTFLLSLSIPPANYPVISPWKARFRAIVFCTVIHVWRIYKFACRVVTRQGAIERACQALLGEDMLCSNGDRVEFGTSEARRSVWRIGISQLYMTD